MAGKLPLRRDSVHSILGGVCSGLAAYFDLNKNRVRIAALVLFIFAGVGLILYVAMWILVPAATTRVELEYMKQHNGV